MQQVFRREEVKYVIPLEKYGKLMEIIEPYLEKDQYFEATNASVYYDTPDRWLAVQSLEQPLYKEKIRVRSYNTPELSDTVFVEIKKKYNGVGSKRRIPIKLSDFYEFTSTLKFEPTGDFENDQIMGELLYCFKRYKLEPALYIAYDRTSYCDEENPLFRVTFDSDVRLRTTDLKLEAGDAGEKYFKNGEIVMEVKALGAYPLWFVRALSRLQIYPASFSKYNKAMKRLEETGF